MNLLSRILELLPDAVLMVDGNGKICFSNTESKNLFGYTAEELIGNRVDFLIPERFRANHESHRKWYTNKPSKKLMSIRQELYGLSKSGKEIPIEISLGPIDFNKEKLIICILRDTSSRQHIELLENKNRELEELTYVASHDLQEPLRTVMSFSALLTDSLQKTGDKENLLYVDYINSASLHMSNLVKSLLDYSRLGGKKQLRKTNCDQLLVAIESGLQQLISSTKTQIIKNELPVLMAYPVELGLLFQNLITNAIKFKKKDVPAIITISCEEHVEFWQFVVEDNGIGIEENKLEQIFILFRRLHLKTEYKGTGIGLAHCKKIVNLHQGRIWATSTPNIGSSFYFTIKK